MVLLLFEVIVVDLIYKIVVAVVVVVVIIVLKFWGHRSIDQLPGIENHGVSLRSETIIQCRR